MAQKSAHFGRKMVRRLRRVYCVISSCDVVLSTEWITRKGFWGETTCRAILNWVPSLNLQTTTRILMFRRRKMKISTFCIANTRRIVLQSRSLVHNTTSSGHVNVRFEDHFWEQNRTMFRRYNIANFFQILFKLWSSVLKMLNFRNIEKLIALQMHLKYRESPQSFSPTISFSVYTVALSFSF